MRLAVELRQSTFDLDLRRHFGSKDGFGQWLRGWNLRGVTPQTARDVAMEVVSSGGSSTPLPNEFQALSALEEDGIPWSQLILERLNEAKVAWPEVAEAHKVILEKIEKALN